MFWFSPHAVFAVVAAMAIGGVGAIISFWWVIHQFRRTSDSRTGSRQSSSDFVSALILPAVVGTSLGLPALLISQTTVAAMLWLFAGILMTLTLLAVQLALESDQDVPAIQLHWGGFGGGIQAVQIQAHAAVGFLALLSLVALFTTAHQTLTSPTEKQPSSNELRQEEGTDEKQNDPLKNVPASAGGVTSGLLLHGLSSSKTVREMNSRVRQSVDMSHNGAIPDVR